MYLCKKKRKKNFKIATHRVICKKLGIKPPINEQFLEERPFYILGYGANGYLAILKNLKRMFICLTIFFLPVFYIYMNNNVSALINFMDKISLGNLGSSSV